MNNILPEIKNATIIPLPTISKHIRSRGLDHTFLIAKELKKLRKNNFYVEKLTDEEKMILISNNEEQILNLIKNTYKNIITYTREDLPNKRFKINYTFSTSEDSFSYNDELVIAIYYGKNTIDLVSKENYLDNYNKKQEFLNNLSNNLSNEIKNNLDLDCKIIYKKL